MTKVKEGSETLVPTSSSRDRFDHPNRGHKKPLTLGHGKKHSPKVLPKVLGMIVSVVKLKNFNIFQVQSMTFQGPKMDM